MIRNTCRSPIVWLGSLILVGIAGSGSRRAQTSDVKIEEDLSAIAIPKGLRRPSPSLRTSAK
ncbi:MAG: hypothetical protein U1D30_12270 [Planctomycetota bacterium]